MALETLLSIIIQMLYFIISEGVKIVLILGSLFIDFFVEFFGSVREMGIWGMLTVLAIFFPFLYLIGRVFFDNIKKVILFGAILLTLLLLGIFLG